MKHSPCRYPIDRDMAAEFLRFLDPEDRGSVFLWLNADSSAPRLRWQMFLRRDEYLARLPQLHHQHFQPFVSVNSPGVPKSTRRNEDMKVFRAYCLDFDGGPSKRPAEIYPPDMRIQTKNGEHWYWQAICGQTQPHPETWRLQMDVLALEFGGDPQVCDPARVMRMPGACHLKDINNPFPVTILEHRVPPAHFTDRGDLILTAHGIDMRPYYENPPRARAKAAASWSGGTQWPEHVIDFFQKLRRVGVKYEPNGNQVGEWIARCPLRDHKSARAVIKLRDNGEIFVFCQAAGKHGCTSDEILSAWHMGWGERLPPGWKSQYELNRGWETPRAAEDTAHVREK